MVLSAALALATGVELPLEILVLADNVETLETRAADAQPWLAAHGQTSTPGGILMDDDGVWVDRLAGARPATFVCAPGISGISESALVRLVDTKSVMIVRG